MKYLLLFFILILNLYSFSQECKKSIVYFNNNNSTLTSKTKQHLDSIISSLDISKKYLIELYGHTDDKHTEDYNLALGLKRVNNVKSYFEKNNKNNLIWFLKTYGENKPQIENNDRKARKLNRRVELFIVPLDSSGGFTLKGVDSLSAFVKYNFFSHCGYCESNAKLIAVKSSDSSNRYRDDYYKLMIHMDCLPDDICHEVLFRIPYSVFNPSAKIKIPSPLRIKACSDSGNDSIKIDALSKIYNVGYDTTSNEYIIQAPCYNPHWPICCRGVRWKCKIYRLDFPNSIQSHYFRLYNEDSLTGFKDSIRIQLCTKYDTLYSIGKINGRYVHLSCNFDTLVTEVIIPKFNLEESIHVATIEEKYYSPFIFKKTILFLRTPKKLSIDTIGFYLNKYDYIIPIQETYTKGYKSSILDYDHSIGIIIKGKKFVLPYKNLRVRNNKRKNRIRIKIKKRYLKNK